MTYYLYRFALWNKGKQKKEAESLATVKLGCTLAGFSVVKVSPWTLLRVCISIRNLKAQIGMLTQNHRLGEKLY